MLSKNLRFILLAIVLFLSSQINLSYGSAENPDDMFLKELGRFVTSMQNGKEAEGMASLGKMAQFSKRYPHSKYADDAQFIVTVTLLAGKWTPGLSDAFLAKYPDESLEPTTQIKLEKALGPDIYFPYKIYFLLPAGEEDARRQDYQAAKAKALTVLRAIDESGNPKLQKLRQSTWRLISHYDVKLNKQNA